MKRARIPGIDPTICHVGLAVSLAMAPLPALAEPEPGAGHSDRLEPTTDSSAAAQPQSSGDAVSAHVQSATEKFDQKDYIGAVADFKAAYALEPDPNFLYNIGRTYEEAGQLRQAVKYYDKFVHQPEVELELRKQAMDRIKVLREIVDDEAEAEPKPQPEPVAAAQPPQQQPSTPPQQPDDTGPRTAGRGLQISGYTMLGLGLSAVAGGATVGSLARRDANSLAQTNVPEQRQELVEAGFRKAVVADVLSAVGGTLAATGIILAIVGSRRKRVSTDRRAQVTPAVGPQFRGLSVRVGF